MSYEFEIMNEEKKGTHSGFGVFVGVECFL